MLLVLRAVEVSSPSVARTVEVVLVLIPRALACVTGEVRTDLQMRQYGASTRLDALVECIGAPVAKVALEKATRVSVGHDVHAPPS